MMKLFMILSYMGELQRVWIGWGFGYLRSLKIGLRCLTYCIFWRGYAEGKGT